MESGRGRQTRIPVGHHAYLRSGIIGPHLFTSTTYLCILLVLKPVLALTLLT